jgi:hypothetical protein
MSASSVSKIPQSNSQHTLTLDSSPVARRSIVLPSGSSIPAIADLEIPVPTISPMLPKRGSQIAAVARDKEVGLLMRTPVIFGSVGSEAAHPRRASVVPDVHLTGAARAVARVEDVDDESVREGEEGGKGCEGGGETHG